MEIAPKQLSRLGNLSNVIRQPDQCLVNGLIAQVDFDAHVADCEQELGPHWKNLEPAAQGPITLFEQIEQVWPHKIKERSPLEIYRPVYGVVMLRIRFRS